VRETILYPWAGENTVDELRGEIVLYPGADRKYTVLQGGKGQGSATEDCGEKPGQWLWPLYFMTLASGV